MAKAISGHSEVVHRPLHPVEPLIADANNLRIGLIRRHPQEITHVHVIEIDAHRAAFLGAHRYSPFGSAKEYASAIKSGCAFFLGSAALNCGRSGIDENAFFAAGIADNMGHARGDEFDDHSNTTHRLIQPPDRVVEPHLDADSM